MAWTQDDLDRINKAIATGEKTVSFADRSVTYRSLDELLSARAVIAAEVHGTPRTYIGTADKGF